MLSMSRTHLVRGMAAFLPRPVATSGFQVVWLICVAHNVLQLLFLDLCRQSVDERLTCHTIAWAIS
jgi:hypothetical protein